MKVPTTADVTRMRATTAAVLAQTCSIQRVTATADGQGGWTESTTTVGSGIACRLAPMGSPTNLDSRNNRLSAVDEFTLYVGTAQDIEESDRVTIDGVTYTVEGVISGHEWAMLKTCRVTRID